MRLIVESDDGYLTTVVMNDLELVDWHDLREVNELMKALRYSIHDMEKLEKEDGEDEDGTE